MTTDTILDIVQRLGLMDLVVDRVRARLEEVDLDQVLDEVGDYMRRNPEVVVDDREIEYPRHRDREREAPARPRTASPATRRRDQLSST